MTVVLHEESDGAAEALAAWSVTPTDGEPVPIAGAQVVCLGRVPRADLETDQGLAAAARRLAPGYRHGRPQVPVIPFLEVA